MEDIIYSDIDYMNVAENFAQAATQILNDVKSTLELMTLIKALYEFMKPLKEIRDKLYPPQTIKPIMEPMSITKTLNITNTPEISTILPLKNDNK